MYQKNNQFVYEDACNRFIYEVFTFIKIDNIFSMAGHEYYTSEQEINYIETIYIDEYIEINCELYSAPKKWLIENDYIEE